MTCHPERGRMPESKDPASDGSRNAVARRSRCTLAFQSTGRIPVSSVGAANTRGVLRLGLETRNLKLETRNCSNKKAPLFEGLVPHLLIGNGDELLLVDG